MMEKLTCGIRTNGKKRLLSRIVGILILVTGCFLSGCAVLNPAASMRIDVEVYKGPLSKPENIQWGELKGVIDQAENSLVRFQTSLAQLACQKYDDGFGHTPDATLPIGGWPNNDIVKLMRRPDKVICNQLWKDAIDLKGTLNPIIQRSRFKVSVEIVDNMIQQLNKFYLKDHHKIISQVEELLEEVKSDYENSEDLARLIDINMHLAQLKSTAARILAEIKNKGTELKKEDIKKFENILITFRQKEKRLFLEKTAEAAVVFKAKSASIAASFVPLITDKDGLRTMEALLAVIASEYGNQMGARANILMAQLDGTPGKNLPLSAYLADSGITNASHLYDWFRAKAPLIVEEWKGFLPIPIMDLTSRVRSFEGIYNDIYWSNINTVYASGTGDVSMALIRDEVGNWNLKGFDNDPTDLLKAYSDLGITAVKTAGKLIKASTSGGSTEVLAAAGRLANTLTITPPSSTAVLSKSQVAEWHSRTLTKLNALKVKYTAADKKAACTKDETKCRQEMETEIRAILHDHAVSLSALQELSVSSQDQSIGGSGNIAGTTASDIKAVIK